MRIHLALVLALLALASPSRAADWDRWFHVSWEPEPEGKTPTPRIEGLVRNDSPYRVTDVQLEVEGLTPDERSAGRRVVWALGDIEPGGESSFVTEAMDGAVTLSDHGDLVRSRLGRIEALRAQYDSQRGDPRGRRRSHRHQRRHRPVTTMAATPCRIDGGPRA